MMLIVWLTGAHRTSVADWLVGVPVLSLIYVCVRPKGRR